MVSKLNNDRKAGEGAGQAIGRIYGKIGFGGLWNGLPVRIFMIGTLTAFQWLIYDSFKVYLGVSSFSALLRVPRNANGGVAADNGRTLNAQREMQLRMREGMMRMAETRRVYLGTRGGKDVF
jgi:hypothetical protein